MDTELTTKDIACAHCGGALRRLGEDVTDELEYVPGRFITNRIFRPRLFVLAARPLPTSPTIAPNFVRAFQPRPAGACAGQQGGSLAAPGIGRI